MNVIDNKEIKCSETHIIILILKVFIKDVVIFYKEFNIVRAKIFN